jgi:hypothetical protein
MLNAAEMKIPAALSLTNNASSPFACLINNLRCNSNNIFLGLMGHTECDINIAIMRNEE